MTFPQYLNKDLFNIDEPSQTFLLIVWPSIPYIDNLALLFNSNLTLAEIGLKLAIFGGSTQS